MATLNRVRVPVSEPMLVRQAVLSKQELAVASAQYGAGNLAPFEGYEANSLRLETFVGNWDAGLRKFVGEYSFVSGGSWLSGQVDRITDFNKLPGIALQRKKTPPAPPQAGGTTRSHTAALTPPAPPVVAPQAIAGGIDDSESEVKHVADV